MNGARVRFAASVVLASATTVTGSQSARAAEPEITSDTAAQFYDVRSPTGETVLTRRRLTTTLGAAAYDLLDESRDPRAPSLTFRARVRYDADYGASAQEADRTNYGRLVPGFSQSQLDLMYGYVEGRKFLHGWLGFKLGRQYVTDVLGWWSFDGGQVRVSLPFHAAVEAYGGLEQRSGFFMSGSRFEGDGMTRGDRSGYDPALWPSYQPAAIAPAVGAAVETTGFTFIHSRLTYRRVENTGASNASEFQSGLYTSTRYDGARISSERLGLSVDGTLAEKGGAKSGLAYDLYNARVSSAYASVDGYLGPKLTLSLDYDFYQPTFDADSIWNFFQAAPMNDIGLRGSLDATDKLSVAAGGHARAFAQQTKLDGASPSPGVTPQANPNYYPSQAVAFDGGGNLAAKYKWGTGLLGLRSHGNFGSGGDSAGGDAYGERILALRYIVEGRAGVWQWHDKLRPDRDATSFGYTAGVGYRLAERSKLLIELDHNMNRLVGQRLRVMAWLTVAATR